MAHQGPQQKNLYIYIYRKRERERDYLAYKVSVSFISWISETLPQSWNFLSCPSKSPYCASGLHELFKCRSITLTHTYRQLWASNQGKLHFSELWRGFTGGKQHGHSEDMKTLRTKVMLGIQTCNVLAGMHQTRQTLHHHGVLVQSSSFLSWFYSFHQFFMQQERNKYKFRF